MNKVYQLDFFKTPEECEMDSLYEKIEAVEKSCTKVRKALFARHNELFKKMSDLEERLSIIERHICKGV